MERHKWLVLSSVSVGTFMATLDGGIVNVSLPQIAEAFAIDIATVEWVVIAYLLTIGSLILPIGRAGEILTFRRVYLAGFALFTAASVLCGLAPGAGALVAFRVVQGVGAAMLMAMGPAIIARTFGAGERGRALGLNAISVSIGLSIGPALGGFLTEFGSWRAIFLVNVPIGILAILWAARVLAVEPPGRRQTFDLPGAALAASAAFSLLLALSQGQAWGWTSPAVLGLLFLFVALGTAFVAWERRAVQPMIDLGLFRVRAFSAGLASVLVAFAGLFTATFLLPFVLQDGAGFSPLEAGLLLTPIPITTAFVAPLSGALSDRIGSRVPASLGMAMMTLGILSLTQLPAESGPVHEPQHRRGAGLGAAEPAGHRLGHARPRPHRRPGAGDRGQRGDHRRPPARASRGPGAGARCGRRGLRARGRGRLRRGGRGLRGRDRHQPGPRTERAGPAAGESGTEGRGWVSSLSMTVSEPARDHVAWDDLDALVATLADQLTGERFDVMLTITRGGMVPAGMLAYRLGIRNILVAAVAYYDDEGRPGEGASFLEFPADPLLRGRRVLVVDEVWDSGTTIAAVVDRVRQAGGEPVTAVLHYKPARSRVALLPDFFAVETDAWVVYPFKAGR